MSLEDRREWLSVAWATLKDLPSDLLRIGCDKARKTCDHPSKIVPTIMREVGGLLEVRRARLDEPRTVDVPKLATPDYVTAAQAADILREFGLRSLGDVAG